VLQLHGAEVRVIMEFDNIETIKRAIESMPASRLLPEPTVLREVAAGSLVAVPLVSDEFGPALGNHSPPRKELGITTRRFIELLQSQSEIDDGDLAAGPATGQLAPSELTVGKNGVEKNGAEKNGAEGAPAVNGRATSSWIASSRRQI